MSLDVSDDESNVDHFDTMNENPIGEARRRGVKPDFKRGKYKRMGKEKERVLEAAQDSLHMIIGINWRSVEAQAKIAEAIQRGQRDLERVLQNQARMFEHMLVRHDSQVSCIAQVSGLCDSVVDVTGAKLVSMTNELSKMSANLNDLSAR